MEIPNSPSYQISEDGMSVTLNPASESPQTIPVEAIEEIIKHFGIIRAQMKPKVPMNPEDQGNPIPLEGLYLRHASDEMKPLKNGALLVTRSERYGWLDLPMTPEFCQQLLAWLSGSPQAPSLPLGATLN